MLVDRSTVEAAIAHVGVCIERRESILHMHKESMPFTPSQRASATHATAITDHYIQAETDFEEWFKQLGAQTLFGFLKTFRDASSFLHTHHDVLISIGLNDEIRLLEQKHTLVVAQMNRVISYPTDEALQTLRSFLEVYRGSNQALVKVAVADIGGNGLIVRKLMRFSDDVVVKPYLDRILTWFSSKK